jgi:hypothetical protein
LSGDIQSISLVCLSGLEIMGICMSAADSCRDSVGRMGSIVAEVL